MGLYLLSDNDNEHIPVVCDNKCLILIFEFFKGLNSFVLLKYSQILLSKILGVFSISLKKDKAVNVFVILPMP